MGVFDNAVPYRGQRYKDIKADCLQNGIQFVDENFPPSSSSLFCSKDAPEDIIWKRPGEIVSDPQFFTDGVSSDDFSQGSLGNCWFVAACACLAEDSKLWKKIVPDYKDQEWCERNQYCGIFHFRFWRCGEVVDVVIDDYLPTRDGKLIFIHSNSRNEFWSPLLEKAYAKLAGDYESLKSGHARDALVDMTGGVAENLKIASYEGAAGKDELFRILRHSSKHHSLMSASIHISDDEEMESVLSCGLVRAHAYSITAVKVMELGSAGLFSLFSQNEIQMIRCRNPWGSSEWTGAWSDGSDEWGKVSEDQKKDLGLTFDDNGEFWMAFEDFCRYFSVVDICHMMNTSFFTWEKTWREESAVGAWQLPNRCGGCANHSSFLHNPQYLVDILEDETEVLFSLEQGDKRLDKSKSNFTIGITITETDVNRQLRMHDMLSKVSQQTYINNRSSLSRITLKRGRYLVVPSTFEPGFEGKFLLRTYCGSGVNLRELVHDEPPPVQCCGFLTPSGVVSATQITIVKAEGLQPLIPGSSVAAYCVVKWEGSSITCRTKDNTQNPEWNDRVTLYRTQPDHDIIVEVHDRNTIGDIMIGYKTIQMAGSHDGNTVWSNNMYNRTRQGLIKTSAKLFWKILNTEDISSV